MKNNSDKTKNKYQLFERILFSIENIFILYIGAFIYTNYSL